MSWSKRGTDYRSFGYLEAGIDYPTFELAAELDRVPAELVPLNPEEEKRVERLVSENIMISLHEHPNLFPADLAEMRGYDREARMATAYAALADSYWDGIFDNFQNGTNRITSKSGWKWDDVIYDMGMRLCDLAHQDLVETRPE